MATNLLPLSLAFITICKKAYRPLYDDNDELLISNLGALRLGFQALLKEDADDDVRAQEKWALAKNYLIKEEENEVGAGAQGSIQVEDSFEMQSVGSEPGWPGGYAGGYWPWR